MAGVARDAVAYNAAIAACEMGAQGPPALSVLEEVPEAGEAPLVNFFNAADAASALVDEPRVSVTTLRRKFGLVADIDCLLVMMFGVGETMWVVDENGLSRSRFWFVTLLDLATILRDEEGVRELLEKGARPAVPDLSDALTHCLVGHPWREPPDLELAQLLVDAGADVNTTGLRNYPRLIKVIEACNTDDATKASLVSFLLENGADVNLCKDDRCADGRVGVGPLFKAAQELSLIHI